MVARNLGAQHGGLSGRPHRRYSAHWSETQVWQNRVQPLAPDRLIFFRFGAHKLIFGRC